MSEIGFWTSKGSVQSRYYRTCLRLTHHGDSWIDLTFTFLLVYQYIYGRYIVRFDL